MAAIQPVILAFEDLQWADSGLLDFIDYLLEWSAVFPIFIVALGRPELLTGRPRSTPTITLAEARAIYAELGATRWFERIDHRSEVPA